MDTKSILNIATLKPEEAAKAIADAALVGVTPDEYNSSKEVLSPLVEQVKTPKTVNRNVASAIGNSQTTASLVKNDLGKLNSFDRFTTYFKETLADVDRRRRVVELANKKRRSGGVLSSDEEIGLEVGREELATSGKLLETADYNMLESAIPKATGAVWDMMKGAWDNMKIVGSGAAVGAATGAPAFLGGPLAGTIGVGVGALRGAGFGYGIASIKDSYEQTSGSMYNDLDTAKRPDGTDLNLPEIEKDNISTGLGLLSGSLDGISNVYMIGKALPGLKTLLNPKRVVNEVVKEAVVDTAVKKGFTNSLSRLGKVANTLGAMEASTEALQEMMSIVAEEMGQTFDGSETSLTKALNNISTKLETSETFRSQTASRVGEAFVVGAVTDRIVTAGGKIVSKPVEAVSKAVVDTLTKKPTNYINPEGQAVPVETAPQTVSDVIQETKAGSGLTGVESMQLHIALMAGNKALNDAEAQNVSDLEFRKIQQKILDDNGLSYVWMDPDKLNQQLEKLPADKRSKVANILDPSGAFANDLNGPIKLDAASVMRAIQEEPEIGNLIKAEPEAPSSGDHLKYIESRDEKVNQVLSTAGISAIRPLVAQGPDVNVNIDTEHDYEGSPIDSQINERKKIYHGTRGPEFTQLDPSVSGGMVFFGEDVGTAQRYATGAGITRSKKDQKQDMIVRNPYNETESLNYDGTTDKWIGTWGGEQVSLETSVVDEMLSERGSSKYGEATLDFKSARIIESSYDPNKVLDISKDEASANKFLEILSTLKNNKTAKRLLEAGDKNINRYNVSNLNGEFWSLTKYASNNEEFTGKDFREISQAMKDAGFEGIRFNDDIHKTVALFDVPTSENIPADPISQINQEYMTLKNQLQDEVISNPNRETETVIDHNQRVEIETSVMQELARAESNPEVKMVDQYLQSPDNFKVDVNTLSPEQRAKARSLPFTTERNYLVEGNGRDALTVARELGFENADQMIRVLGSIESTDQLNTQSQTIQSEINNINQKQPALVEAPQVGTLKKMADNVMKASVTFMNKVYEMTGNTSRLDVSQEQAQMQAEVSEAVRFTPIKDLNIGQFRQGQAKSRKLGNDFAKAKDFKKASKYFRAEAYNTALIANTMSAIEQANSYFKNIKRFMQPEMMKTMQKAGKEFLNGYTDLMQVFAVVGNEVETRSFDNYLKLVDYLRRNGQTGIEIPQELLQKLSVNTDLKDFTVEELAYVSGTLDMIEHLAKNKDLLYSEVFARNQMNKIAKIASVLVSKLKAHVDYDPSKLVQSQGNLSMGTKLGQWVANFETNVDNIIYLTKRLNGKDPDEIFTKLIYDPLAGTGSFANTGIGVAGGNLLRKAVRDRIEKASKKFGKGIGKLIGSDAFGNLGNTPIYVPEFAQAVKLNNGNLTKKQLLNIAIYYGNIEGRKRLENFGVSSETIFNVLQRELGTEGFDFVQEAVWDTYEQMKERSFEVERTTLGLDPKEVKGLEFEVKGKKYRGGYAPLKYRAELELDVTNSKLERALEIAVGNEQAAYENQNAAKGMTERGYLEARVREYDGVLDISSNIIERGFEEHINDISMRIPLMDVMKLLKDERVAKEISSVIGLEGYNSLVNHVIAMTKTSQMVTMELMARSERSVNKVANMLKNNLSASYVALNVSSIMMSFASIPTAWSKMGFLGGSKYLANTLFRAATNPHHMQAYRDLANEIVPSLKDHVMDVSDTLLGGISDAMPKEYFGGTSKLARYTGFNLFRRAMDTVVNRVGFKIGLGQMDYSIKAAFTVAMYQQFRDGGVAGWPKSKLDAMSSAEAHRAAVSYVNGAIVSTLPTANTIERARVQKSHPLIAMFWNDLRNVLNHVILKHREMGWDAKEAVKAFQNKDYEKGVRAYADVTSNYMNLLVMSALGAAITSWARSKNVGEEEEERESILTAKGIDQFGFEFASILTSPEAFVQLYKENFLKATPWLRHVVDAVEAQTQGNRYRQNVSTPLTSAGTEFAVFAGAIAQWMQTPPDEEFEFSPKQLNAAIRTASFVTPFPANAVIKFAKAVEENEPIKGIGEPTIGVEMIGQLNAFIQMYKASEVPETKELVKEAEQIVQDLGPKTVKLSNNAIANDILAGTQPPIDQAVYGWIRFLESGMNDEAFPVKKDSRGRTVYKKDSKGEVLKDLMGNPVPQALSSAYGRYQITDDTWNAVVNQAGQVLGLTDKTDPEQQEIAMDYLVRQNANILTTKGIPVTAETIYSAHYQGPQVAARIYDPEVNPLRPFKSVFPDSGAYSYENVIEANPWLRTIRTVGQYRRYIQQRMAKGRKGYENWLEDNLNLD